MPAMGIEWDMDFFEVYNIDDYMATSSETESLFFLVVCSSC